MYGMTETANWIGGGSLADSRNGDGYVGRSWGGQAAVIDGAGSVKNSGRGEVVVQSPSIMLGYWNRPDLGDATFAGNWFRTGDIGDIDELGDLTLIGRIKTEINRGGIKIQAEEVDMLLERHDEIGEACAFGMPDPVAGEVVAAAIVMKPGARFDPEAIKAWCSRHARPDAVPVRIVALETIPRNARGKVVRSDVRKIVELQQK
jgi:acyl-CoA synthetase (AMP-forming)/AMP-acid ligase II